MAEEAAVVSNVKRKFDECDGSSDEAKRVKVDSDYIERKEESQRNDSCKIEDDTKPGPSELVKIASQTCGKIDYDGVKGAEYSLTQFPDCVLLHLLQFLDATSLFQLSRTCSQFANLVLDKSLWRCIDGRYTPNKRKKVKYLQKRINAKTTDIRFAGQNQAHLISNYKFFSNKNVRLTVLAIENQFINAQKHSFLQFPKTLEELSLRGTFVQYAKQGTFMRHCSSTLVNLRVLIVDDCQWFTSEQCMYICKLPKLEILSLYKCKQRTSAEIGYLSLTSIGFQNLKILNCRFSSLSDEMLKVMYKHPGLQEMYFQCYERTYRLEKAKRELEILSGKSKVRPHSYLNEEYDINDTNKRFMHKYFGPGNIVPKSTDNIDESITYWYRNCVSKPKDGTIGESVLYEPQYGPCECNFFERFSNNLLNNNNENCKAKTDDEDNVQVTDFEQKLCRPPAYYFKYVGNPNKKEEIENVLAWLRRKIQRDLYRLKRRHTRNVFVVLPDIEESNLYSMNENKIRYWTNLESTRENKRRTFLFLREPRNLYEIEMVNHAPGDFSFVDLSPNRNLDHDYYRVGSNIIRVNNHVSIVRPYDAVLIPTVDASSSNNSRSSTTSRPSRRRKVVDEQRPLTGKYPYYKAGSENDDSYTELSSSSSSEESEEDEERMNLHFECNNRILRRICSLKQAQSSADEAEDESLSDFDDTPSRPNSSQNQRNKPIVDRIKGRGRTRRFSYSDSSCPSDTENDLDNVNVRPEVRERLKAALNRLNALEAEDYLNAKKKLLNKRKTKCNPPRQTCNFINTRDYDNESDTTESDSGNSSFENLNANARDGATADADGDRSRVNIRPCSVVLSRCGASSTDDNNQANPQPSRPIVFHNIGPVENAPDRVIYINILRDDNNGNPRIVIAQRRHRKHEIQLKKLSLRGFSRITDETLRNLNDLELELLDVTHTGVTNRGVRNYILSHPHTRVIHESACVCGPRMEF